ncbi:MAG TPA: AraC family transcriptional regulator ligand-binding domain-containing protein, partial [Polyangia bacterium]
HVGLRTRPSSHGLVGLAAMTAPTVRAALERVARFAPTRSSALALELTVDGNRAFVIVDELASLGGAQDTILLALAVGAWQLATTLTGRSIDGQVDFAFAEPAYFARLRHLVPFTARFGTTRHRLSFDAALLDLPLPTADLAAERLLSHHLERELQAQAKLERVSARVRHTLVRSDGGFRTLDEVAAALHVSPRTLRRQLAVEQASFSDLLEEERRERALVLLRGSSHTLEEITEQLGYSDVANFARAFRRWTGQTPGTFRRGSI